MESCREMPVYQSHKKVWALKIKEIEVSQENGSGTITPEDEGYAPFQVSKEYMEKHQPTKGGYFVEYKGGYKSFSPAKAFEEGYSRI